MIDTATIRTLVQAELRSGPLSVLVRQLQGLVLAGVGSPEGAVRAPISRLYQQEDGAPGSQLWQKQTGDNTDTGWVAIA